MANPQPDIFVKVSKEFYEALAKVNLPGRERQVLDVIILQTWGYQRKAATISNSLFRKYTGLKNVQVSKAVKSLLQKRLISKNGNNLAAEYQVQKDYESWDLFPKTEISIDISKNGNKLKSETKTNTSGLISENGNIENDIFPKTEISQVHTEKSDSCKLISKNGNKGLISKNGNCVSKNGNKSDLTPLVVKNILKKKDSSVYTLPEIARPKISDFEIWYSNYPKKRNPKDAKKAWECLIKKNELPDLGTLLEKLDLQKTQKDWIKDGGRYIPYPATYLRAGSYLDEVEGCGTQLSETMAHNILSFKEFLNEN
jgi:phage replication O-like protein O